MTSPFTTSALSGHHAAPLLGLLAVARAEESVRWTAHDVLLTDGPDALLPPQAYGVGVFRGGELCAVAALRSDITPDGRAFGRLISLYVHPDARRRGAASAALDLLGRYAREMGLSGVLAEVPVSQTGAGDVLRRAAFEVFGTVPLVRWADGSAEDVERWFLTLDGTERRGVMWRRLWSRLRNRPCRAAR